METFEMWFDMAGICMIKAINHVCTLYKYLNTSQVSIANIVYFDKT